MTYIDHNLLNKTVSRIDGQPSWPFQDEDVTEAKIIAVWVETGSYESRLRYAVRSSKDGLVASVYADFVRHGDYLPVPKHEVRCPKCSALVLTTYAPVLGDQKCQACDLAFPWKAPKT